MEAIAIHPFLKGKIMSVSAEWYIKISNLLNEKNYDLARTLIRREIDEETDNGTLYLLLAKTYHITEEDTEALFYIDKAIQNNNENTDFKLWKLLVSSILRKSNVESLYTEIENCEGQLAEIAKGEYFYYKCNYSKAFELAKKCYENNRQDVEAFVLLLKSIEAKDIEISEINQYLKQINEVTSDPRLIKLALRILYRKEEYVRCNKLAKKIVRLYPNTELSQAANTIIRKLRTAEISSVTLSDNRQKRQLPKEARLSKDMCEIALSDAMEKLNQLIGLNDVKTQINSICKTVMFERQRAEILNKSNMVNHTVMKNQSSYHFVFLGNPGTGKTTVARLLGEIFHAIGVLEKGQLIETDRSGLVGEYIGATAQKTQAVIKEAMGGVLFIDEAYSLYSPGGSSQDFGMEAIDTLVKAIEDHRDKFIVILAGYKNEMKELMKANPGLESRFTRFVEFPDYSEEELLQIAEKIAGENLYTISDEGKKAFITTIRKSMVDDRFGNARTVRNIVTSAFEHKAVNADLSQLSVDNITLLSAIDFGVDINEEPKEKAKEYLDRLNALIGLQGVKEDISRLIDSINYQKEEQQRMGADFKMPCLHMVFQGNPGTGKTTIARLYGNILREIGVLAKGQFIEASRADLVGQYQGQTASLVKEKCQDAYGGILFIDEAYSLCTDEYDSFGKEAVNTLIKEMEDNREKLVVILAGYNQEIENFLNKNPGFKSRISKHINFEDYNSMELFEIFDLYCRDEQIKYSKQVEQIVMKDMEQMAFNKDQNFGNARDVRKYFEEAKMNMVQRVQRNNIEGNDRRVILESDLVK